MHARLASVKFAAASQARTSNLVLHPHVAQAQIHRHVEHQSRGALPPICSPQGTITPWILVSNHTAAQQLSTGKSRNALQEGGVRQLAEPAASVHPHKCAPHSSRKTTASANAGSMSGSRASSRQPRSGSAIGCTQSCAARCSAGRADSSATAPASCATSAARKARQSLDACPTWAPVQFDGRP